MPKRHAHNQGAQNLSYLPKELEGTAGMHKTMIDSINRWMDNPATKTGQYRLRANGELVTPSNHRTIRHNPDQVGRVFSGNGAVNQDAKVIAKIHRQMDGMDKISKFDRKLIEKGLPGSSQLAASAKYGAAFSGGASIVINSVELAKGDKKVGEAVGDITKDSISGAVDGSVKIMATGLVQQGIKHVATSPQIKSQLLKQIARNTLRNGNVAFAIASTVVEVVKDGVSLAVGKIDGSEFAKRTVSNGSGGVAALSGARIGAIIGSRLGPVGAATGAFVGGVIGGITGSRIARRIWN